jgi:hypothetical protein
LPFAGAVTAYDEKIPQDPLYAAFFTSPDSHIAAPPACGAELTEAMFSDWYSWSPRGVI